MPASQLKSAFLSLYIFNSDYSAQAKQRAMSGASVRYAFDEETQRAAASIKFLCAIAKK